MPRSLLPFLLSFLLPACLCAQMETTYFEILPPIYKVPHSLYRTIGFLDSRWDTSSIGITRIGMFKSTDAKLVLRTPVQPQLQRVLNALVDSTAGDGELLFQLRDFNFIEPEGLRFCYLTATLYARTGSRFRKLSYLDTVITVKASDITKMLEIGGNGALSHLLANSLLQRPSDTVSYDMREVMNIDSIEKHQIPIFNVAKYTDGVYFNYTSFSRQQPDMQGIIEAKKNGSISSVSMLDQSGKKIRLKPGNLYALVYQGHPFIATDYGYYPMQIVSGNLFFTGEVNVKASNFELSSAGVQFGLLGAAAASMGNKTKYEMIIDHLTGKFVHLRLLENPGVQP